MRKVRITIARDGTQRVEVIGAQGEDCLELTWRLERRLGRPVGERTLKPETADAAPERASEREQEGRSP